MNEYLERKPFWKFVTFYIASVSTIIVGIYALATPINISSKEFGICDFLAFVLCVEWIFFFVLYFSGNIISICGKCHKKYRAHSAILKVFDIEACPFCEDDKAVNRKNKCLC